MRWIRRFHGAFWWMLDKLAHVPHLGPLRYRAWVCKHFTGDTDAWFWSPPWQWGEWRASRDIKAGRVETFSSVDALLVSLDATVANASSVSVREPQEDPQPRDPR